MHQKPGVFQMPVERGQELATAKGSGMWATLRFAAVWLVGLAVFIGVSRFAFSRWPIETFLEARHLGNIFILKPLSMTGILMSLIFINVARDLVHFRRLAAYAVAALSAVALLAVLLKAHFSAFYISEGFAAFVAGALLVVLVIDMPRAWLDFRRDYKFPERYLMLSLMAAFGIPLGIAALFRPGRDLTPGLEGLLYLICAIAGGLALSVCAVRSQDSKAPIAV